VVVVVGARGGKGLRNIPSSSLMIPFISQSTCQGQLTVLV